MNLCIPRLGLVVFPFWQAVTLLGAHPAALPGRPGFEPLPVAANLGGRYTRSPVIDVDFTGTDARIITGMAVVMQDPADRRRRLELHELRNAHVVWSPVRDSMQVDLGEGDGVRSVWFGFRAGKDREEWIRRRVYLDTTPPDLKITEPLDAVVSDPLLQVKATSADDLAGVRCRVNNSRGATATCEGAIIRRTPDLVTGAVVQTCFECRAIELSPGANVVTFELKDAAGNTSEVNVTYTLDPSVDKTPPEITVHWPTAGDQVFAPACRIRGHTSERSVRIEARCADGTVFPGLAELTGHFWIYDVPLAVGWNVVTVAATDAAGNQSTHAVQIERHPVEIHIDPPTRDELATRRPTVTGTISNPDYVVWVNGTKAEMDGTRWTARSVLLNSETGTAITQAVAIHRSQADACSPRPTRVPRLEDMGNPKTRSASGR